MISWISDDEYSYSFLLCPKMMTATSTEQRTDNSCAFLNSPPLRLRNVTDLWQEVVGQQAVAEEGDGIGVGVAVPVAIIADGLDLVRRQARGQQSKAR